MRRFWTLLLLLSSPLFPAGAQTPEPVGQSPAVLSLPKDAIEKPLLFGSRLLEVNRTGGKVLFVEKGRIR